MHFLDSIRRETPEGIDLEQEVRRQIPEAIRFAIRAMVSLYGQHGYDLLLEDEEVQQTIRSTPLSEFGEGGIFPNILLPESQQTATRSRRHRAARQETSGERNEAPRSSRQG